MLIHLLADTKTIVQPQSRKRSIGQNKRVLHFDLVYLTDVPYDEPDLLDSVVDWLEEKEDVTAIDIMYVADVENQCWTLRFRVDEKLLADEYTIDTRDLP